VADAESISLKRNGNGTVNGSAVVSEVRVKPLRHLIGRLMFGFQVAGDILVIAASMLSGYWLYHWLLENFGLGRGQQPLDMYLRLTVLTIIILLLIFERMGLYRRTMSIMNIEEVKGIFKAVIYAAVILFTASFYIKDITYSRLIVTYSLVFLFIFLNIERYIFYKIFQKLHVRGIGVKRALVYGAGEAGRMLVERFVRSPRLGTLPVGFLDDNPKLWGKIIKSSSDQVKFALPVLGGFDQLLDAATEHNADELFISLPSVSQTRIAEIIRYCEQIDLKFNFIPNLFDYKLQHIAVRSLDGVPLLTVKEQRVTPLNNVIKRIMDLSIAGANLLILSPLMIVIAVAVKWSSPGPILFRQERVGLNGKKFTMYKFRSMYINTPKYALTPESGKDPRITPVGRILRRTSLDELPQLFNVIKGDMSIVGPRPEMPFIVETYNEIQRERLKVKPGITGLWQISADRAKQIHENIEYDLYYVENASPLLDLVIILRTIIGAIVGKGAY
jgi:exopolysaccharide biosynthesis polyprenyl glycosylphosphotransferase